jgi:hypothetical protein
MYGRLRMSGFAWLSGRLGGFSKGIQDLNRAIGFVRAFGDLDRDGR